MIPIKFRGMIKGKNDKKDQWVYGYLTRDKKYSWMEVAEKDGYLYFIKHSDITSTQVNLETVGQFIGLLDKNGKEIYDGDIIARKYRGSYQEHQKIEYSNTPDSAYDGEMGYFIISYVGYSLPEDFEKFEVIGNIYENPELVKL